MCFSLNSRCHADTYFPRLSVDKLRDLGKIIYSPGKSHVRIKRRSFRYSPTVGALLHISHKFSINKQVSNTDFTAT
jgi:hypothetical protein